MSGSGGRLGGVGIGSKEHREGTEVWCVFLRKVAVRVCEREREWLKEKYILRWHGRPSAEVNENINLGYSQDQGYS